jgi:hypothetical protein
MALGVALFTIAVGAILKFAVHAKLAGIDLGTVGLILIVAGVVGLVAELGKFVADGRSADGPT